MAVLLLELICVLQVGVFVELLPAACIRHQARKCGMVALTFFPWFSLLGCLYLDLFHRSFSQIFAPH